MSRYLVACDAGGTMTDVIIVDEEVEGRYSPSNDMKESRNFLENVDVVHENQRR